MKKSIIAAGAASVALAAMPVVGAFAASTGGPFTDTLVVNIDNACTFSRGAPAHTDGDVNTGGTVATGSWGTTTATPDTVTGTLAPGEYDSDFGSSAFNVICNNENGWKVTAAATALTGTTTTTENIPLGTPAADIAAWNYTSSSSDTAITGTGTYSAASQIVAQSTATTPTAGRNFSVLYKVSVNHALSAQTYQGTIEYTFAQLP